MKTFRTSSDIYVAFCRCTRGHLHVLSLTNALTTRPVTQGSMVGLNLFNFVLEWGTDKKKAAQIKHAVESVAGTHFFIDHQFKSGSLFFRRMVVNTEPYAPFPISTASPTRSETRILSTHCHPSSSAITLTGNVSNTDAFVSLIDRTLKKWGQPDFISTLIVPMSAQDQKNEHCKVRFFFSPSTKRVPTRPILKALLKDLS